MDQDRINREFLGQGIAFPLQMDTRGRLALAKGERDIAQAIHIILSTAPGERLMRPEFGCRVHELVFEPRNPATEGLLIYYVEQALGRWEPRIDVVKVAVRTDPQDNHAGTWLVDITYRIKSTHDTRSIVYPFYLAGEEG